jgi:hypothetical protein
MRHLLCWVGLHVYRLLQHRGDHVGHECEACGHWVDLGPMPTPPPMPRVPPPGPDRLVRRG